MASGEPDAAGDEVDVLPTKHEQLAEPQPGAQRDQDHRAPLTFGRIEQALRFFNAAIKPRLRAIDSMRRRTVTRDALGLDRDRARVRGRAYPIVLEERVADASRAMPAQHSIE